MTFNQPDKAMVAWNLLGKVGLKPSLRTWNLTLEGLGKAGNINGLKNIWTTSASYAPTKEVGAYHIPQAFCGLMRVLLLVFWLSLLRCQLCQRS